jgi:hypothetical protein
LPKAAKSWFRHYLSGVGLLFVVSSVIYSVELDSEEKSVRSIGQVQESQKLKLKIKKNKKNAKEEPRLSPGKKKPGTHEGGSLLISSLVYGRSG